MIITRSPFRIPIGGGGTDLPSYYEEFEGGDWISAAIDKYMFITVNYSFTPEIHLRYSKTEHVPVGEIEKIEHPKIREALKLTNIKGPIEIASMADVLVGTGMGSSGSYTVGLLNALHTYKREKLSPRELAEEACHINMHILKSGSGKQDEYASAFGGINYYEVDKNGKVTVTPLKISPDVVYDLEERLLMFSTGISRSSYPLLKDQETGLKRLDKEMILNLHKTRKFGREIKRALEVGDTRRFAEIMEEHWQNKRKRSTGMTNQEIDKWHNIAIANGAIGGKIMGAGGGGFLLFYAEDPEKLRRSMLKEGLNEMRFRFDFEGSKILFNGEQYRGLD